jgi:hypothetical protein
MKHRGDGKLSVEAIGVTAEIEQRLGSVHGASSARPKWTGLEKGTGSARGWEASALRPRHHCELGFTGGNNCPRANCGCLQRPELAAMDALTSGAPSRAQPRAAKASRLNGRARARGVV